LNKKINTQIRFTRKPVDFDEVSITKFNNLNKELQKFINSLEIIDGDNFDSLINVENINIEDQYYIIERNGEYYLVNTEDYDYPRYVTKLIY